MDAAIIVYDADGRILHANAAARAAFHVDTKARFTKQKLDAWMALTQLCDANGAPLPADQLPVARILRGETLRGADAVEVLAHLSNGQDARMVVSGSPLQDTQGAITGAMVSYQDVTAQRRLENRLRFLASALQRTNDAVLVREPGGAILFWNTGAELLYGYAAAEAVGQISHDLLQTAHPSMSAQAFEALLLQDGEWSGELIHTAQDGRIVEVQSRQQILREPDGHAYVLETSHDITERNQLARELAERATLIESTVEAMADGLTTFDSQGRLLNTNRAYRRLILGREDSDILPLALMEDRTRLLKIRHPDGRPMTLHEWAAARVLRGELTPSSAPMDVRLTTLAGREVTLSVSGGPIKDDAGRIVGGVTVFRDVTERRELERERVDLLSLVAHDLANALASVKMRAQRLQRRVAQQKALSTADVDAVTQAIGGMERLISDLRVSESLEAGHFTLMRAHCDLVALCRRAAEAAQQSSRRVVNLDLPDTAVMVEADRDRLGQVLDNLLSNALKYSPADQPVELTLVTEEVRVNPAPDEDQAPQRVVRVTVHDWGLGIAPEALPHLFERYYRAPGVETQRGLGLGLHITRELVDRHGGRIGVESVFGEGSRFWFTIPLAPTST
jgi:PAS domain S-box-containing protein